MPNGKESKTVPSHESVERPWASNDKLTYDNTMTHCKNLMNYSELGVSNALALQQQINQLYLSKEQQRMEHNDELQKQYLENDRYTLDYLYGVYPLEATGLAIVKKALKQFLEEE